jgi:hypothetical protein
MLINSGSTPTRISSLLDDEHVSGWTEFRSAHGTGATGRREGNRAWPGESTLYMTVVPDVAAGELVARLREDATSLPVGERLHVAVLPAETFF